MQLRRLGQNSDNLCQNGHSCPQVLEDETGDFVIVGEDVTTMVIKSLPPGPGIGVNERAIRIPRQVIVRARPEIPTN